jgi:hypothetical protein
MSRAALLLLALASCVGSSTIAAESVVQISPIFGQLVLFSFPGGFKTVFENSNGSRYIRESVREGETAEQWTEMITVTGAKGLAANPNVTPQLLITQIGAGFKRACPETFSAKGLGAVKISFVRCRGVRRPPAQRVGPADRSERLGRLLYDSMG